MNKPNWYAKLHALGKQQWHHFQDEPDMALNALKDTNSPPSPVSPVTTQMSDDSDNSNLPPSKQPLNLSLFFRIWLAVAVVIIICGIVVFQQLFNYVRPVTQQVVEDTLVDTAKLLASTLQPAMASGEIYNADYQAALDQAFIEHSNSNAPTPQSSIAQANTTESSAFETGALKTSTIDKETAESTVTNPSQSAVSPEEELADLSRWYQEKTRSSFRIYVTDSEGIVVYDSQPPASDSNLKETLHVSNEPKAELNSVDTTSENVDTAGIESLEEKANLDTLDTLNMSEPALSDLTVNQDENTAISADKEAHTSLTEPLEGYNAEGQNYSQWNDVYLTLQGQYGARSTRMVPDDDTSSVMYVAQPIYSTPLANSPTANTDTPTIIGVVSVGKPIATIYPYINATRQRMLNALGLISLVALIMAGLIAWWLKQSVTLISWYTQALAPDTKKPYFYLGRELNELTDTIEDMKHRLENRSYVTEYVHTLTHELKSPLTAIRASGELLEASDLDDDDRLMLSQTITEQSLKLQSLIDRLLLLAKIEQPTFKLDIQPLDISQLIKQLMVHSETQRQQYQLQLECQCTPLYMHYRQQLSVLADEFWLTQALQNVIDNALYFAHHRVLIQLDFKPAPHYTALEKRTLDNQTTDLAQLPTDAIEIKIINDGEPIPDYALDKIFDRYFSLSHQHVKPNVQVSTKKGTGLGLTLVKQVVERLNGNITIYNLPEPESNDPLTTKTPAIKTGVAVVILLPISPD